MRYRFWGLLDSCLAAKEEVKNASAPLGEYIREKDPVPIVKSWINYIENAVKELHKNGIPIPKYYLEDSWLDKPVDKAIAYVLASVSIGTWPEICTTLQEVDDVKEASLLYGGGDYNALIKIESTTMQLNKTLIEKIVSNPNILKTQTLHSAPYSQWQKEQSFYAAELEKLPIPKNLEDAEHGIDRFDKSRFYQSPKIKDLFLQEWKNKKTDCNKINNGSLILKTEARLKQFPVIIANAAKKRIFAVVLWHETVKGEGERTQIYLDAQADRLRNAKEIGNNAFEIRRIFVVNHVCFINDIDLCVRLGREINIGVDIRYIDAANWPALKRNDKPRDFGLVDDYASWSVLTTVNDEGLRHIKFNINHDDNELATSQFVQIWDKSVQLNDDQRNICRQAMVGSG